LHVAKKNKNWKYSNLFRNILNNFLGLSVGFNHFFGYFLIHPGFQPGVFFH
jgi:hypothetical protein